MATRRRRSARNLGGIIDFPPEVKAFEAKLRQQAVKQPQRAKRESDLAHARRSKQSMEPEGVLPETLLPSDAGEVIATIRASLGLSITELAKAASVSRQTIYAWIRGENEPQATKRRTLVALYYIACQWNELSSQPAKEYVPTIQDLLKPDIAPEHVVSKLREAHKSGPRRGLRKAGMAALLAKHNIDIENLPDQDEQFDLMTGKADAFGDYDEQEE